MFEEELRFPESAPHDTECSSCICSICLLTHVTASLPLVDTELVVTSALYSLDHAVSAKDQSKTFFVFSSVIFLFILHDCNLFLGFKEPNKNPK